MGGQEQGDQRSFAGGGSGDPRAEPRGPPHNKGRYGSRTCPASRDMLSSVSGRKEKDARRWLVRGRVQGVGFRDFAQRAATGLGLTGYDRNLDDGRVEVYAVGPQEKLEEFSGKLRHGPRWSDVWGVEEQEAAVEDHGRFRIVA